MTAVESSTKVVLGGTRGGPEVPTLRKDRWWVQPVVTVSILTAFIIYSTWAAFQNRYYYVGATVQPQSDQSALFAVHRRGLRAGSQGRIRL